MIGPVAAEIAAEVGPFLMLCYTQVDDGRCFDGFLAHSRELIQATAKNQYED